MIPDRSPLMRTFLGAAAAAFACLVAVAQAQPTSAPLLRLAVVALVAEVIGLVAAIVFAANLRPVSRLRRASTWSDDIQHTIADRSWPTYG